MRNGRGGWALIAAAVLSGSCGGDDVAMPADTVTATTASASSTTVASAPAPTTSIASTTTTTPPATSTSTSASTSTTATPPTTPPAVREETGIWPGPDIVVDTPAAAAAGFVSEVLGVEPVLGDFQPSGAGSGEIVVYSPTDDDNPATVFPRGLLLLRRLGPDDGWFVVAASSDGVSITSPEPQAAVARAPVTVEGLGRGFESTIVVKAFVSGDAAAVLDSTIAMTNWTTPAPYSVTLDLSGAAPGDVVVLVAIGASGLETDPSEFAAVPVVIAG